MVTDIVNLKKKSGKISYSEKSYKNFESFYGCCWRSMCKKQLFDAGDLRES